MLILRNYSFIVFPSISPRGYSLRRQHLRDKNVLTPKCSDIVPRWQFIQPGFLLTHVGGTAVSQHPLVTMVPHQRPAEGNLAAGKVRVCKILPLLLWRWPFQEVDFAITGHFHSNTAICFLITLIIFKASGSTFHAFVYILHHMYIIKSTIYL